MAYVFKYFGIIVRSLMKVKINVLLVTLGRFLYECLSWAVRAFDNYYSENPLGDSSD